MPEIGAPPTVEQSEDEPAPKQSRLTPIDFDAIGYVPGKYAPWYCSPFPCYGPDELGEYEKAIEQMTQNVNKCDAAARIWEVLQAWEMRLFRRNYHFLTAGWKGWGMFGGSSGTTGAAIMQTQNAMKLFSCNVFGARHKKIVSLLARQLPSVKVVAEHDDAPEDQTAAEVGDDYLKIFENDTDLKRAFAKAAGFFYTDDRVGFLTYTVADASRWGTELPDRPMDAFGIPQTDGVTPETEMDGVQAQDGEGEGREEQPPGIAQPDEVPVRREVTWVGGKLETKVPILADEEHQMGWKRFQWEESVNRLRAQYPWVKEKIATQGNVGGMDQIDRMARINVRLAVQASSSSGEAWKNDATHTVTFYKPAEYESIKDEGMREVFYDEFPDGLEVWHAGGQLAIVRNCRSAAHTKIIHATTGDGQNREAIGTNYLPLQKVLNANISLIDRYFRGGIARRFAAEPYIDTQLLNSQSNDPAKVTPVYLKDVGNGVKISDLTGAENVPQLNTSIMEFVQWLINGAPEAMDGASAELWGAADNDADEGVFRTARLRRDEAKGVFTMPWLALCEAMCAISLQAIESAALNRTANISASIPGQKKLEIELSKLQGSVLVHPESLEIPRTLAEQEEQAAALIEQSANVGLYRAIVSDPRNFPIFAKFPSLSDYSLPGLDQVEVQQGEFEILMKSGPVVNPAIAEIETQIAQVQQQIVAAEGDGEAATPEGQQALVQLQQAVAQLQQQLKALPPQVSTMPVAQNTSQDHTIHAIVTLGMMNSPTGRKLKNGNEEQQAIYANLDLHWQEHMAAAQKLAPPKEMEFKGSVSIDPSKFPPQAQAEMFQAMGLQVPPFALQPEDMTHEVTTEKEGVDANGVPVKQKVSVVGKPLS